MTSKIKVDNITDQNDNNIINESGDVITVGASGDTVAVAGNIVKSNALQASDGGNIVNQSGTTITLGASGDTVTLASGASQSGFGRTGTVDWQTGSVKTATFTATSGEGYFCNTSGGAFQVNLPAGTAGSIVSVQDYNNSFDSNTLTVQVNGSQKINGGTASGKIELDTEGEGLTLVYIDDTVGWRSIHNSNFTDQSSNAVYVAATGGNATVTCGNFKTHIFTGPGTFCVSCAGNACGSNSVEYLVVAGGGGAAMGNSFDSGGGGGAGGFRTRTALPSASPLNAPANLSITASPFPITVGGGGAGQTSPGGSGSQGNTSTFSSITSAGGGKGEFGSPVCDSRGGSGGGIHQAAVAAGNFPPVAPPQGQPGGTSGPNCTCSPNGGGGGGAAAAGGNASAPVGGSGGAGSFIPTGFVGPTSPSYGEAGPAGRYFAGGGAGGMSPGRGGQSCGTGGLGGGGDSTQLGVANTGGGGGASDSSAPGGRQGGSGIVMIRYQYQGS